jgi:mRNA-degrading endonuclease toxin of MazEF toxin-antitoxin module
MSPLRGEIWDTNRRLARVLVVSGGMYNSLPDVIQVLIVPVVQDNLPGGWSIAVGEDGFAVVDRIAPFRKAWLTKRRRRVDTETLTDVNNALFKILATE